MERSRNKASASWNTVQENEFIKKMNSFFSLRDLLIFFSQLYMKLNTFKPPGSQVKREIYYRSQL